MRREVVPLASDCEGNIVFDELILDNHCRHESLLCVLSPGICLIQDRMQIVNMFVSFHTC